VDVAPVEFVRRRALVHSAPTVSANRGTADLRGTSWGTGCGKRA
jgi:hypothetical protein